MRFDEKKTVARRRSDVLSNSMKFAQSSKLISISYSKYFFEPFLWLGNNPPTAASSTRSNSNHINFGKMFASKMWSEFRAPIYIEIHIHVWKMMMFTKS